MRIQLHSMTDLITNSSTVIYTYSDASVGALKEMIDEMFRSLGMDKKCDDIFHVSLELESYDGYIDSIYNMSDEDLPSELKGYSNIKWPQSKAVLASYLKKVENNEIPKPDWMKEVENKEDHNGRTPSTILNIVPKKPEFDTFAKLVKKFLYSTTQESAYDG